jgi:leader peptidase (prepilin peptidase) / N-methyltransferase
LIEAAPVVQPAGRQAVARLVAFGAASAAAAAYATRYGLDAAAVVAAGFLAVLALLSAIDLEQRRIPNVIVLPAVVVAVLAAAVLEPSRLPEALLAGFGAFLFFFVPSFVLPGAVGMGDAKLALLIGAMLGREVVGALLLAAIGAGLFALVLLAIRGRAARSAAIPFGPFLAAGAAIAVIGGGTIYA